MERLETIDGTEVLTPEDSHKLLQEIMGPGLANECALSQIMEEESLRPKHQVCVEEHHLRILTKRFLLRLFR